MIRFDHGGRFFALARRPDGTPCAAHGQCAHEKMRVSDGPLLGDPINCPKHDDRFNIRTGAAPRAPVCDTLISCPARIADDRIEILL